MTLYVYEIDTLTIVDEHDCDTNQEAEERWKESQYNDTDIYAITYSPAFGCYDGLHY